MRTKKFVAMLMCAALAGTLPSSAVMAGESSEPVNIVFAGWSGEEEATRDIFQRMMQRYEEESGNTVTWVGWTWADTAQQMLIRAQGGEQMDIAQSDMGPIFNTVATAGALADWTDILGEDYLQENFEQAVLDSGIVDGRQLGLPWSEASITMVYNPEILGAAGWDEVPSTIAEFEQCLADIKAYDSEIIPYAVSTKDDTCAKDFMPWLWTYGGSIFDEDGNVTVDSEACVQTIEWYQKLLENGFISMDTGRGEARQMFAQGKVAFYDDAVVAKGQAVSNGVDPDDVAKVCSAMPRPVAAEGDQPQSMMWGHMLVAFQKSEYLAETGEFAKSLLSDEMSLEYFRENGMPPVTKSAANAEEIQNDAFISGFLDATATARMDETAFLINSSEVKTILVEELQAALLGQKSAEKAAADMGARLNAL